MIPRMLWGNILIRPIDPVTKTKAGLILPENSLQQSKLGQGHVLAVGSGSLAIDGSPIPIEPGINLDVLVAYKRYEAEPIVVDGETLYTVDQRQIVAILNE